ncbi:hypothetical protein MIND_00545900 [Mycena indigotica]|uniref:Uncharacterized protein n=1 Tax=Mycena indigotica TaxID=2126181 RepID=A0A8H6SX02_9AGAR|nr:uncharacterized protein MIND_00545900 [Mycena indigotica]KAF7307513.1 hypothetical protein MIND_00545900 [Mycena indigotica]
MMTPSESLNLNSLASSLPSHSLNAHAEKALLDNFKAAALSITTLYRSSRHASKRAYNAGYAAACRDLMEMLQLGVSDSQVLVGKSSESGMTVGRVMDWVEARLEAVKAREEEEDEEDGVNATGSSSNQPPPPSKPSSSSPPVNATTPVSPPRPSIPLKPTRNTKLVSSPPTNLSSAPPSPETMTFPFAENVPPLALAGTKRRHAMMMMPNAPTSSTIITSAPSSSSNSPLPISHSHSQSYRRRTRSTRGHGLFPLNQPVIDTLMDVEDEGGRERKRIARR